MKHGMQGSGEAAKLHAYRQFAERFLQTNYGLALKIPVRINGRLKRTFGRFVYRREGEPLAIELSRTFVQERTEAEVFDILKHELIHYALFVLGRPYGDRDPAFQQELNRHQVSRTGSYAYVGRAFAYRCLGCGREFVRVRRISRLEHKRCGACRQRIKYLGPVHEGRDLRS